MKHDQTQRGTRLVSTLALLFCFVLPVLAEEPKFLAEETTGIIDASDYIRLEIVGIQGTLSVRAGLPGDLRFTARALANRREERALSLWSRERTLILTPGAGLENERLLIEVIVPPNLFTFIEATDSTVQATSLGGDFELIGAQVNFEGRALQGECEITLTGGAARIQGSQSDLHVAARTADITVSKLNGSFTLDSVDGTVKLSEINGEVAIESEGTAITANVVDGRFELSTNGGSVELTGLTRGADLRLEHTGLRLNSMLGIINLETDASVEFRDIGGDLTIESYGGQIVGAATRGALVIRGADFVARLDEIGGTLNIEGDELNLALRDVRGDVELQARASEILIEAAAGNVTVTNDFGDVTIKKAAKMVSVTSSQGNVHVTELSGPIQLRADGPEVTVQWVGSARQEDCEIHNESGTVTVQFSAKAGGEVQASSKDGRVVSNVAGIQLGPEGESARGFVNRQNAPKISISAGGDITLSTFQAARAIKKTN